ncbi:MAG: glycoside hydrolase family 38 C-terminal domain-containing protein [Candidatus Aminicenantales bacterium]
MSPKSRPTVHLICNAHLDPVWQWRWEEGASEALATFRNAVEILDEHPHLIFCHNEAVLYQWVERYDPGLFADIRRLARAGRWAISGGWFIQPDVNLPGTESLIRQIAEGRRYFRDEFGAAPRVAYNFDSFGHSGGLPQILRLAGYEMYIHMRPQSHELDLPADLYRWRGADGTEIPAYRISVGLYHTERDNIEDRLRAGVALALRLSRDVPVFWGLGNHGGGATRGHLRLIDAFIREERRVRIIHSTPDVFADAVREAAKSAPVFEGDLQRSFTGCYTSLSRLKRQAVKSLGGLVQSEALAAAAWWLVDHEFPARDLREAWRAHLFNDFHDIITGSCVEPGEQDALGQYGKADDTSRGVRLGAVAALDRGAAKSPPLPVTVANANPSAVRAPVEFECMADYRPFWKGEWHLRLFRRDGREIPCQEEQPEALLPFNGWRRRISFLDELPGVGVSRYEVRAFEGPAGVDAGKKKKTVLVHRSDRRTGLVTSLKTAEGLECLAWPIFEPLVIEDEADSWGTGSGSYRKIAGRFKPEGPPLVLERGPVRTISQSVLSFKKSRIVMDLYSYPDWPVLDFRFRITWNEERRRLKLRIPTSLAAASVLCEVPGAAVRRPPDGQEHVQGRWLLIEGQVAGRAAAVGIASGGQHGFDFKDGEARLSLLRSSAYCHERGFDLGAVGTRMRGLCPPRWKFADIGVHAMRFLVTAGDPDKVRAKLPGLADYLSAPPAAFAHLPAGADGNSTELLSLAPANIRLLACKPSWDGEALVLRLQETAGRRSRACLSIAAPGFDRPGPAGEEMMVETAAPRASRSRGKGKIPPRLQIPLAFKPFEIKTVRVGLDGRWAEVRMIEEDWT